MVVSLPLQFTEMTSNAIFGFGEKILTGQARPTNVTGTFQLDQGPKLKNLAELRKPVSEFLHRIVNKYFPIN